MDRLIHWLRAWPRNHPLLSILWVLFFVLCLVSVVSGPDGERPNALYGIVILPLLALVALLYFGRTVDRFKKIRELTGQRESLKRERLRSEQIADRDQIQDRDTE